ncbi:MAG: serine hydrolase domain-containing protein [Vicinamibacterales bacterium]
MRRVGGLAVVALAAMAACGPPPPAVQVADSTPGTLDGFRESAARILEETRVPGAGIALVRAGGIEWAGGLGWADRDARRPVDADTLFRVGSISKTFVALALVQLYEEGRLDLDAPIRELLPDLRVENPWEATDPVRLRHVLEHTAGFDDMHFNEIYVLDDTPDRPLEEVLLRNPASRRVRWRPGTRMAYSNPGYAVAGRVIETVTGEPFDAFIRTQIFDPLGMNDSTFSGATDDPRLALGYQGPDGPPIARRRIHLRPAGALHSSARELGQFVEMLLGWGERSGGYVVDPEYLANMEWPRTTAAARAGVRAGYGLGIYSTIDLPYHVLGHQGGIDGFLSAYGYSPSRDVGYVVLLNATHSPDALRRLASLAIRYLKGDIAPAPAETMAVSPESLAAFAGYYHDVSPRNAVLEALTFPVSGRTLGVRDGHLTLSPTLGRGEALVPVNDALFRRDGELMASLAVTAVDGRQVLAGPQSFAERRTYWPIAMLLGCLGAAAGVVTLSPAVALAHTWRARRRRAPTTGRLGVIWLFALAAIAGLCTAAALTPVADLGAPTSGAWTIFLASLVYPALVAVIGAWTPVVIGRGLGGAMAAFASLVAVAHLGLAGYLAYWGLLGFRSWTY